MPNGGSDCCGTCWFNAKNEGHAGYDHARDPEADYCTIRSLPIRDPSYTYCGNHPHHRRNRDSIPIGPVFKGDSDGVRRVWRPSPDTEEVRRHLLALLAEVDQQPTGEYPAGWHTWQAVVWQLGEFKEARAVDQLHRIAAVRPARPTSPHPGTTNWEDIPQLAREALVKIGGQPGSTSSGAAD